MNADGGFSPRLTIRREIERKGFHLVGLILPAGYVYLGPSTARVLILAALGIVLAADMARLYWSPARRLYRALFSRMSRESEEHRITGASLFMLGQTACVFIFPPDIVPVAMAFGIVGDLTAAIVGKAVGGPEWRVQKTVAGSAGCFAASFLAGIVWMTLPWTVVASGAAAATLAEGLSGRINDNLVVPTVGGVTMWIAVGLGC